jgi:predicted transcriptional regulator
VPAAGIPEVIGLVFESLTQLGRPVVHEEPQRPAVPIRRSVTAEYIVCLEDGKKLKMLKRHLRATYCMTPEEYRAKWSLPADYPMVAPTYAEQRSAFAKAIGLSRSRPEPEPAPVRRRRTAA